MGKFKTRKQYRLTFVNENTFNAVWSLKLSRLKVWVLSAVCVAAIAALVLVAVVWTPVSGLLPGYLKPAQRRTNVENLMRVDSLLEKAENQQIYIDNILSILSENGDSVKPSAAESEEISDTLLAASENEREFVREWTDRKRNSLSVLTPIVAEGMLFQRPADVYEINNDEKSITTSRQAPVYAINDGTVVNTQIDVADGSYSVTIQHMNDFITVTGGLESLYVGTGDRIKSGQVLGKSSDNGDVKLNLWHEGRSIKLSSIL